MNQRISVLEQELIKANQRNRLQNLIAPITGTVHQLAVNTIGAVVTPAQEFMVIVPSDKTLEVEALLVNKDIGFVEEGQSAETKIEAFPFTKYGVIDSKLLHISDDAVQHEQLGLVYKLRLSLEESMINVGSRLVNLSPGMTVIIEIKTDQRKILEYFFSPLIQSVDESVWEKE